MDITTVLGATAGLNPVSILLGLAGRIVPEVVHLFTAKQDAAEARDRQAHEQAMYAAQAAHELDLAKVKLDESRVLDDKSFRDAVVATGAPLVDSGSWFLNVVNAITALMRPYVVYTLFTLYATVRASQVAVVLRRAADFDQMLVAMGKVWTADDMNMLATIIAYLFVDRTIAHLRES